MIVASIIQQLITVDIAHCIIKDMVKIWLRYGYKRYESVKVLQLYCGELPFDLMYDFIKWRFLTSFSDVPVRFHIFYELNRQS